MSNEPKHADVALRGTARVYCVGGSVRDRLLGLAVQDHDWVVVGSTPEDMVAQGFQPVGKDFPVFLHPQTHEEYALARTERKTARGYKGFAIYAAPDVTLEQDLLRRDFTINAIAQEFDDKQGGGKLIDPHNGVADLRAGILRHVSAAFGEDPVRILRAARFAARFGFSIAPETLALMRDMVNNGEVDALGAERVWQELARGPVGVLGGAFGFQHRAGDAGADARHGEQRRSGRAGCRTRVAGTGARPDGEKAVALFRDAAQLRRAGENPARGGRAVRGAEDEKIPPGNRLRHPPPAGGGRCRAPRLPAGGALRRAGARSKQGHDAEGHPAAPYRT